MLDKWHKVLMTPAASQANDENAAGASGNRSLTVAAPIDSTATPSRAATVRERSPGERLFSRKGGTDDRFSSSVKVVVVRRGTT